MGDDLTAARRFCGQATTSMELLMAAISNSSVCAPHILVEYLADVQSQAKSQHAIAIYRAAQNVIDAVLGCASLERVQGRALSLNKLIVQYQAGLDEIAPAPANAPELAGKAKRDLAPEDTSGAAATMPHDPPPVPSAKDAALAAKYDQARAALRPLMGLTKTPSEAAALSRLAGFTSSELSAAKGQEPSSDEAQAAEANTPAAPQNTISPIYQSGPQETTASLDVDFETLMPQFTSEALQAARQTQKTVSVSYAAEDVRLSFAQAQALQPVLQHIAQKIVTGVLERPETRARRGESSAGHIALTASQHAGRVSISMDCPGAPMVISAFTPNVHNVKGLAITPGEHTAQGLMHIILSLPAREDKAVSLKEGLGARLAGAGDAIGDAGEAALRPLSESHARVTSELAL